MRCTTLVNHLSQDEIRKRMVTSKEREQYQRWQSIFLTSKGLQSDIIAEYVGATKGTIHQWVYQYNHNGPAGFTLQGRGGRRYGFLSLEEEAALLDSIRPRAEKGRILNAFAMKEQIEERLAKRVSKDYLYDLLHRHKWRKVMPRPQHPKADKEKQDEFKKLPELVATAAKDFCPEDKRPVKLFFQDEGRFGRISDPAYCWAPSGLRPIISSQIVREFTHVFSAVSPNDGQSFSLILPYANTDAMNIFLQEFSEAFQEYRIILVMDKAAWHRSKDLSKVENIRYIYQPPYSPELNPVEHLWKYIRENYFKNAYWLSMENLETALAAVLKKITDCSEIIQSLVGFRWAII